MTRVLIADDEAPARMRLRRMLEELGDCDVVGEARHGGEAVELSAELRPDVLLLDIRMPEMDGIEAARHLSGMENSPAVIFTTAFDSYAIDAFDAQAVGYLLKPVRRERLVRALGQAARLTRPQASALAGSPATLQSRRNLCVRKAAGLQLIPIEEVKFFKADQKYVTVHHLNGEDLLDETLKDLTEEFRDRFIRIHRSALVSTTYLERMTRNSAGQYELYLKGVETPLPVSRRHITDLKLALRSRG